MSRPLRVAVVARAVMPLHGTGGLERSVRDLVRHLAARDVDVTLITPEASPVAHRRPADPFGSPRIHLRHVPYRTFPLANRRGTTILDRSTAYPLFGLRAGREALRLVQAREIDIVHGFGAAVLGYARARRRQTTGDGRDAALAPLVFNPQGLEEFGATSRRLSRAKALGYLPLRVAVRACARAADAILATDVSLESTVERHLRPRAGQLRTIPNGIDLVEASGLAGPAEGRLVRQQYGIRASDVVLLSVGRLEHNKGFDVLAAALGRAGRPDGPLAAAGWRWVIVGAGPYRAPLERAVEAAGLASHAIFVGRAAEADLHAWYEAATVFVHPSRYEGSSLVTLEAMAHRRAVIATTAGGLPDKVRPGVNGWLVEPDDAHALAAAVEDAVVRGAHLPAMGARSREIVERDFAWPVLADRTIALYRELLEDGPPPAPADPRQA
ncbi:MAG: glycosyltransferase family 4 protein [Vicinamibacterales bacterium]